MDAISLTGFWLRVFRTLEWFKKREGLTITTGNQTSEFLSCEFRQKDNEDKKTMKRKRRGREDYKWRSLLIYEALGPGGRANTITNFLIRTKNIHGVLKAHEWDKL